MTPPKARAILLADHVYRDAETGKCVIAGTFNRIGSNRFPAVHPAASIYLHLTDFVGKATLNLRICSDRSGEVLGERAFVVESTDRLGSCEVTVLLNNLRFPEPGKYSIELYSGDDYLGHLPIELVSREDEPAEGV